MSDAVAILDGVTYRTSGRLLYDDLNVTIPRGKVTAIVGPSGVGKTTLLRLLGGLILPNHGEVRIFGENINTCKASVLSDLRLKMGLLFQQGALFSDMSVFENVAFQLRELTRLPDTMIHDLVVLKLESVGLRGASDLMVSELSGGMARRVALARTLMLDPSLMLYDEPFTGQDPINKAVLLRLIKTLNEALGMTSVLVSHDIKETFEIADYVYVLVGGRIVASGTAKEVSEKQQPVVQQFLRGQADGPAAFKYPARPIEEELGIE